MEKNQIVNRLLGIQDKLKDTSEDREMIRELITSQLMQPRASSTLKRNHGDMRLSTQQNPLINASEESAIHSGVKDNSSSISKPPNDDQDVVLQTEGESEGARNHEDDGQMPSSFGVTANHSRSMSRGSRNYNRDFRAEYNKLSE